MFKHINSLTDSRCVALPKATRLHLQNSRFALQNMRGAGPLLLLWDFSVLTLQFRAELTLQNKVMLQPSQPVLCLPADAIYSTEHVNICFQTWLKEPEILTKGSKSNPIAERYKAACTLFIVQIESEVLVFQLSYLTSYSDVFKFYSNGRLLM